MKKLLALASIGLVWVGLQGRVEAAGNKTSTSNTRIATNTKVAARTAAGASAALTRDQIVHVLNRLTFGPRPGDIERVQTMGIWQYVGEQLNPALIADPLSNLRTPALDASRRNPIDVLADYNQQRNDARNKTANFTNMVLRGPRIKSQSQEFFRNLNKQYVTAKLQRAIDSPRQLQEVMTEFWYQHFNVCINKDVDRVWVGPYEDQAIRPYALGHFRELLGATCHHPAMLYYLDNWQNTAPNSAGAKGNQKGLNENYARELMELHTLGVDGGYTQKDVIELARILTGLGYAQSPAALTDGKVQPIGSYGATFDKTRHDFGDKTLLGRHFAGTGEGEVEQALDMLARQPATAHHVCIGTPTIVLLLKF